MAGFWESCLLRFEQELPEQQFNTWIKPLRLEGEQVALEEGLRLIAPNGFIQIGRAHVWPFKPDVRRGGTNLRQTLSPDKNG